MGEIYDKWSVCDWKVRCWDQEPTVSPFRGKVVLVEASFGVDSTPESRESLEAKVPSRTVLKSARVVAPNFSMSTLEL